MRFGGPNGGLGAATRYLQQRYSMPYGEIIGLLTDIGTEELAHVEMISALIYQLTRGMTEEQIKKAGFAPYFVDHTAGDTFADLHEDMAAEQKARLSYDNILRLVDDPDVKDTIRFLRERELVHFQRFGEAVRIAQDKVNARNFYAFNPSFDTKEANLIKDC